MKGTDHFKTVIEAHLQKMAAADPLFAKSLQKEGKNIDDCITYILNTVKNSGCSGFTDDEVFGMAVHYYDEDNIEVGSKVRCDVVTNHKIELTAEEKAAAREEAIRKAVEEERQKLYKKTETKKVEQAPVQQATLF